MATTRRAARKAGRAAKRKVLASGGTRRQARKDIEKKKLSLGFLQKK